MKNQGVDAQAVIGKHANVFEEPPSSTPADHAIDGPLLGNGDLGVAISGPPSHQRFWIAKNDFWKLRRGRRFGGGPAPIGGFDLRIRDLFRVGSYRIEQDLFTAEANATFESDTRTVRLKSWVAATENILVIEIICDGTPTLFEPELWIASGRGSESELHADLPIPCAWRRFAKHCEIETGAGFATALVAGPSEGSLDGFTLSPGEGAVLVAPVVSNFDAPDYVEAARERAATLTASGVADIEKLNAEHRAWWAQFWNASLVEIDDPVIEAQYFRSQYILASASRNPQFPPSIFGTWITTDDPSWMGDYHLNYNHMAPYYGLYSSNHIEQAAPYEAPILDFVERGRFYASSLLGTRGVYFPVGIGPKGVETTWDDAPVDQNRPHYQGEGLFFGQKSNAAYAVVNVSMRWYATYDLQYARQLYPFVLDVAEFWQDYLKQDGDRLIIEADSIHEGSGEDFNPILSLGLVRCVFETVIDMSTELGVDEMRRHRWQEILENVSSFPTYQRDGKAVFSLSERGVEWWHANTLGIQHIYPAGAIGPDSDPDILEISRDTITAMDRWFDGNGMNSFYPAAVRVGYDPEVILRKLKEHCETNLHPNGYTIENPHGIETCSTIPNTINEMLLTSHGGTLRLFYGWPANRDARFANLRTRGAFLVSARQSDGVVDGVSIRSERGRLCSLQNPWPGSSVRVIRADGSAEIVEGAVLEIETAVGELISLERKD